MLMKLESPYLDLQEHAFVADEVQYNLIYRIMESKTAIGYKSLDGHLIIAQTPDHNGWLWVNPVLSIEQKCERIKALVQEFDHPVMPGISSEPEAARLFAEEYSIKHSLNHHCMMTMESYDCPIVIQPLHVAGSVRCATSEDTDIVTTFLADFSNQDDKPRVHPSDMNAVRTSAKQLIAAGGLRLWFVDGEPVSMANASSHSRRYGRINAVYTAHHARSHGYARAVVASLCTEYVTQGLIPMLYADRSNLAANKAYRNIGFEPRGPISDIRFIAQDK